MNRLCAVAVVAACSGRAPAPTAVSQHPVARADAGVAATAPPDADGNATTADCTAMIDHMIDLDVAERPAEQRPSPAETDKARTDMRAQLAPRCTQQLTHAQATCAAHAATAAAANACL